MLRAIALLLMIWAPCVYASGIGLPYPTTNEPPTTNAPPTTGENGCFYEGKWHPPGEIARGYDGRNWCYGVVCDPQGEVIHWDDFKCGTSSTPEYPTTFPRLEQTTPRMRANSPENRETPQTKTEWHGQDLKTSGKSAWPELDPTPTNIPKGCYHNGKWFPPGSRMTTERRGRRCFGTLCSHDGYVVTWDELFCGPELRPITTLSPPTRIPKGWLRRTRKPKSSRVPYGRDLIQPRYTRQPVTTRATRPSLVVKPCFYKGRFYVRGMNVMGSYPIDCKGLRCSLDGKLVKWDYCHDTTPPATPPWPTTPPGCHFHGKWYPPGSEISMSSYGECESGLTCDESGMIMVWDGLGCFRDPNPNVHTTDAPKHTTEPPRTTPEPTTEPPQTTPEPTTEPSRTKPELTTEPSRTTVEPTTEHVTNVPRTPGCLYEGKWYPPGNHQTGYDGRDWCYGIMCDRSGQYVPWDNVNCGPTTTSVPRTTPKGCYHQGKWYPPGSEISRNSYGGCESGLTCGKDGMVIAWDGVGCFRDLRPSKTPTTEPQRPETTTKRKTQRRFTTIKVTRRPEDRPRSTRSPDTRPRTTRLPDFLAILMSTALPRYGCYENDRWYRPGAEISRGQSGSWCYGTYCSESGEVIAWDDWNCKTTARRTTKPSKEPAIPTTKPIPKRDRVTPEPTTTPGCHYHGKWYPPGSEISRSSYGGCESGLTCDESGMIMAWDGLGCFKDPNPNVHTTDALKPTTEPPRTTPEPTTEPPRTTPEPTTEPSRTTPELTTEPSRTTVEPTTEHVTNVPRTPGCLYEGKWYPPGNHQTGYDGRDWCYGIICDRSGQYVPWDNVNCGPTTTSVPRTTPKGCYHQGKWYPPGSEISRNSYGGCESGLTCGKDGMVIAWDGLGCFRDLRPSKTPTTEPQRPKTTTKRKTQRRFTTIKVTRRPEDRPRSTRSPDTRPRTTRLPDFLAILMSTALPRYGCYENDRWYRPGAEISRGQSGSWCYGTYCSESGEVIAWDDWNCKTTARRTTKPSKEPAIPTTKPIPKRDRVTPEPTTTPGCHYHGKWYPPGSEISRSSYGGCESGLTCDESGMIMAWDGLGCFKDPNPNVHTTDALKPTTEPPRTTPEPTTEPPRTTPEPTTEPSRTTPELTTEPSRTTVEPTTEHVTNVPRTPGCLYEGKWYPPGNHQTGYDGRDWCYGIICDRSGQYVPWDNVNCGPTTTSVPRTTPKGCYHQGKWYPPGSEISRNSYGGCESGLTCGKDGMVIAWDGLGCFRDLRPPKTPTTEPQRPKTTTKRKTQRRFTTIKVTRIPEDRPRSTRSPDTRPRTTRLPDFLATLMSTALPRYGCYENDRWYRPGAEISRGQSGSWCYGTYCSESGEVIAWDDWNCKTTARRTTEPSKEPAIPTTEPIPKRDRVTPEPTTTPGCHYHGKWYLPGSEISRSSYGGCESGLTCDESGMIMAWDGLGCFRDPNTNVHTTDALKPTTEPPRTTPEPTTEPSRTTPEPTTEPSRTKPEPTTEPSRTKPEPTTEPPRTTSEPTTEPLRTTPEPTTEPTTDHVTTVPRRRGCLYEGKLYPPGNHQTGYDGRDWCYGIMCDRSGQYEPWDNFNCGPETTVPQTSAKRSTTTAPTTNDKQHPRTDSRKSTTDMRGQTPRQQSYECYYEGKWFAPGSEIYRSSNGHNWCFGARCSYDGNVIMWDDFNCEHHLTRLALKIHRDRKSHPLNCYYRGRMYQTGNKIIHRSKNGKCYRAICAGGKIANWRSAVCPSVEVRLRPQMYGRSFVTTDSCQYKGKRYSVGSVVFSRALFRSRDHGWCVGLKCGGNGRIVTWGPQWGGC